MINVWPRGEVVTQGSAKPRCAGSIPAVASKKRHLQMSLFVCGLSNKGKDFVYNVCMKNDHEKNQPQKILQMVWPSYKDSRKFIPDFLLPA